MSDRFDNNGAQFIQNNNHEYENEVYFFDLSMLPQHIWFVEIFSYFQKQSELLTVRLVSKWFRRLIANYKNWSPIFPLLLGSAEALKPNLWSMDFPWLNPKIIFASLVDFNTWVATVAEANYIPFSAYAMHCETLIVRSNSDDGKPEYDVLEFAMLQGLADLVRKNGDTINFLLPPNIKQIVIRLRSIANGRKYLDELNTLFHYLFAIFEKNLPNVELWLDIPKNTTPFHIQTPLGYYNEESEDITRVENLTELQKHMRRAEEEREEKADKEYALKHGELTVDADKPLFHLIEDTPIIAGPWLSDNACGILTAYCMWFYNQHKARWPKTRDLRYKHPYRTMLQMMTDKTHLMYQRITKEIDLSGKKLLFKLCDSNHPKRAILDASGAKIIKLLIEKVGVSVEMDFGSIMQRQNEDPHCAKAKLRLPIIPPPTLIHAIYMTEEDDIEDHTRQQLALLLELVNLLISLGCDPNLEDYSWRGHGAHTAGGLKPELEGLLEDFS